MPNSNRKGAHEGSAVLLIDMQSRFMNAIAAADLREVIAAQLKVIRRCRDLGIPVITIEVRPAEYGRTHPRLVAAASRCSKSFQLEKRDDCAFCTSDLIFHLSGLRVWKLFAMGMNACACVIRTVQCALSRGFCVATMKSVLACDCGACTNWYDEHALMVGSFQEFLTKRVFTSMVASDVLLKSS